MDARSNDLDSLRGDFYLCLARAFAAPRDASLHAAMREALADDLADLADLIGYDIAAPLADYREAISATTDAGQLLQTYSRLFMQPPFAAHINAGVYVDGTLNGGSVEELEGWYAAAGLARSDEFRDLSDHVSVQLEFAAFLFGQSAEGLPAERTAGQFIGRFVARWVSGLAADLDMAQSMLELPANPYLPLARLLSIAAAADAERFSDLTPAQERQQKALVQARQRRAGQGIGDADMDTIRRRLAERGLATDHLDQPYESRDAARGWQRMTPPVARRK